MFDFNKEELKQKIKCLKNPKILVVGDMLIDEMIYGDTERISREAPVLILKHSHTNIILGGAANAAHNIATLNDGKVGVIGTYGNDYYAPIMLEAFKKANIDTGYMVQCEQTVTSVKTRVSGQSSQSVIQQIVRLDRQSENPLPLETEKAVIDNIEEAVPKYDGVILSDYNIGFLTQNIIDAVIQTAKKHNKIVIVDAQKDLERYKDAYAITPNQPDSEKFVGYSIKTEKDLCEAGKYMLDKTQTQTVLITRGGDGMVVFEKNGNVYKIPVFNKTEVFDVTGAGDTVSASFALSLVAGLTPKESAIIGNLAASIVVRQFGCATTTIEELIKKADALDPKFEKLCV